MPAEALEAGSRVPTQEEVAAALAQLNQPHIPRPVAGAPTNLDPVVLEAPPSPTGSSLSASMTMSDMLRSLEKTLPPEDVNITEDAPPSPAKGWTSVNRDWEESTGTVDKPVKSIESEQDQIDQSGSQEDTQSHRTTSP
jgi:Sec7-like guanine-nucleotide exchange factor